MYWTLLRNNGNFRRLYAATLISLAGDWFLTVALLDLVLEVSHSAALASFSPRCVSGLFSDGAIGNIGNPCAA